MDIQLYSTSVNNNFLTPQLHFNLGIQCTTELQVLVSCSGILVASDGKHLAYLNQQPFTGSERQNLNIVESKAYEQKWTKNSDVKEYIVLYADLSPQALSHIEKMRERNHNKAVNFHLEIVAKYLHTHLDLLNIARGIQAVNMQGGTYDFGSLNFRKLTGSQNIVIPQSDWVQQFSPALNIGKFLLLELNTPDINNTREGFNRLPAENPLREAFLERFETMQEELTKMEGYIRTGEWELVIRSSRELFELLKLGNGTSTANALKEIFGERNGSEVGFDEFYKGVLAFFDYASKFVHHTDRNNRLHNKPEAKSEDAYLIYALSVALLNSISSKIVNF